MGRFVQLVFLRSSMFTRRNARGLEVILLDKARTKDCTGMTPEPNTDAGFGHVMPSAESEARNK